MTSLCVDDRVAISDTVTSMLHAIDALDWDAVREAFADRIDVDYTSLAGGSPETLPVQELMARWRALLPGFEATQHVTGPIAVRPVEGRAMAETHGRGYHYIKEAEGGDVWMVAGHYSLRMGRRGDTWKIEAIRLTVFHQEGNLNLPTRAQARASAAPHARAPAPA